MGGQTTVGEKPRNTFSKEERLNSKKLMDELFNKGSSIYFEPVRLVWLETALPSSSPVQVVFSVPKKSFPRAVDRNRIKRLLREAYRQEKHILYGVLKELNKSLAVGIIYGGKKILTYKEVEHKIIEALNRLIKLNEVRVKRD